MHRSDAIKPIARLAYLMLVVTIGSLITACKKESPQYPYKGISQFTIQDANGTALKAVIDNNDIIVYWPPFMNIPDSVTPVIKLSEKARISPASGQKVAFREGITFTVTAEDGSTQSYKLKPVINQPKPYYTLSAQAVVGDIILFSEADYIIPDEKKTKLFLISKEGKEVPLVITYLKQNGLQAKVPAFDAGTYKLKFISGIYTMEDQVELIYGLPYIPWYEPVAIKRGSTIKLEIWNTYTTGATKITGVRLKGEKGAFYPVSIKSYQADNVVEIQIPDNLAAGVYNAIELTSKALSEPFVQELPSGQEITVQP